MRKKSIAAALDEYEDHLRHVKGRSESTIRGYRSDIEKVTLGLSTVDEISLNFMRSNLAASQHLASNTRGRRVAAIKGFVRWGSRRGFTPHLAGIERLATPKTRHSLAKPHTEEDALKLCDTVKLQALPSQKDAVAWCLLELLYGLGLRIEEAVGIDLTDVDPDTMKLFIRRGKGDNDRVLPFGPNQLAPIMILMLVRKPRRPDEKALFLGEQGERLGQRQARRIYGYACEDAGVEELTPHALRHSCATHMLDGGADIRFVAEQLGHSSLATTQRYLHVTAKRLSDVVRDCHPRGTAA